MPPRTREHTVDEIKRLLNQYVEALEHSGYTDGAQEDFRHGAIRFFRWIEDDTRVLEPHQWPPDFGDWRQR